MIKCRANTLALAVAGVFVAPQLCMAEGITFNGFASIVAGQAKDAFDPATDTERLTNIYRYDYDDSFSFKKESMFALQANADLGDGLSSTALIYAKGEDNYEPDFFAAYISYQITDNLRVNAGRIPWPLFQYTDFLDVGYAYPWITPPAGVYDLSTVNNLDGFTLIYNRPIGAMDSTFQFHSDANNIYGVKGSLSYDWLTLNLIYVHNQDTTVPAPPYEPAAQALRDLGFTQQGDDLAMDKDSTDFISVGFNVNYNNFLVIGEYATVDFTPGWFSDFKAYYLTLGYQLGDVLLHATYDVQEEEPQLDYLNGLGPAELFSTFPAFGTELPIVAVESFVRGRAQDYTNITLGVRWDFHPSAAFKVDLTTNDTDDGDDVVGIKEFDQTLLRVGVDLVF